MKLLFAILLLFPLISISQKARVNEYDKFVRQRRIEIEPLTIFSTEKAKVSLTFNSLGSGIYILLSGFGWGGSTIDAGQEVIFLFSNDSTVTGKSTALQSYEITSTGNSYKHKYLMGITELAALSKYDLVGVRKYSFNDYSDMKVSKDCAAKVKKLSALFIEELKRSKIIHTLQHINMKDVSKHIGDSVMFCARIFNTRYFVTSEKGPTLLDVNNTFGSPLINIVIWQHDRKNFNDSPEVLYNNRDVCISGTVELYNNVPQIVLRKKEQIIVKSPISLAEVPKFIGDSVTVEGKIFSGKYISNNTSSPTLLNMGAQYPNQLLTLVIENRDRSNFNAEPENYYLDKDISVTGKIELYKDKPQIVVRNKGQIIEKPNSMMQGNVKTGEAKMDLTLKDTQAQKTVFVKNDVRATFPGGFFALAKYLKDNLSCPDDLENGETRQVIVNFVINTDGTAGNFKIVQSAGSLYDEEVLRVLKKMPKWIPPSKNGLAITENITQPVTFSR